MKCRNTKVFIRILPNIKNCWEDIKILEDKRKIYIRSLQDFSLTGKNENKTTPYWQFDTDGIFYNNSQIEIYETITEDILKRAIFHGNNALILAYGQTGTGKSLTISGLNVSYQDRGILPRFITDLFAQKETLKDTFKLNVEISYIETRRNRLKDLFMIDGPPLTENTLKNVTRTKVNTEDEAMRLLFIADGRRSVAAANHVNSHISNAVFTFYITTKSKRIQEKKLISKIHIVDLMGADRYGYETCYYKSAFDVSSGNLSKSQLEQFFHILAENNPEKTAISQHLNTLIYYLRDTLSTDNILRFVGHIRTNRNDIIISLSMLRFAQILLGLKSNKLKHHSSIDENSVTKKIEEDVKLLRKELELNSMLNNESLKVNITQERIEHMENVAEDYLRNKTNELLVLNICDASTVMKVFKNLYNKLQVERDQFAGAVDRLRKTQDEPVRTAGKRGANANSVKTFGNKRNGSTKSIHTYDTSSSKKASNGKKNSNRVLPLTDQKTDPGATATGGPVGTSGIHVGRSARRSMQKNSSGGTIGPGTSKRRSSVPSEIANQQATQQQTISHSAQADFIQLPSVVPSFNEAWASYMSSDAANAALYDELQMYKENALDANRLYMAQVRILNEHKQTVESRQDDLLKAKLQLELECGINRPNEQEQETIPPLHTKCEEMLKHAQLQFLVQQEGVLKCQTELKLYVQQCNVTKKDINDKFNTYCKETFKTVVPPIPEPEKKMDFDLTSVHAEEVEGENQPNVSEIEAALKTKTDELLIKYQQFKQLREKEYEKGRSANLKNKKWIRSSKA